MYGPTLRCKNVKENNIRIIETWVKLMNANKIVRLMKIKMMTTWEQNLNTDGSVFNVIYTSKGIKFIYIYSLGKL